MAPNAWIIKEKTDKLDFFNGVLKLFTLQKILKKIKRQATDSENI